MTRPTSTRWNRCIGSVTEGARNPSPTPRTIAARIQTVRYLSRRSIDRGWPHPSQSQPGPCSLAPTSPIVDAPFEDRHERDGPVGRTILLPAAVLATLDQPCVDERRERVAEATLADVDDGVEFADAEFLAGRDQGGYEGVARLVGERREDVELGRDLVGPDRRRQRPQFVQAAVDVLGPTVTNFVGQVPPEPLCRPFHHQSVVNLFN
jgi:hypothetical protein